MNDMFYVYGKFRTIRMKIKEVITPLAILDYFLPGVYIPGDKSPEISPPGMSGTVECGTAN